MTIVLGIVLFMLGLVLGIVPSMVTGVGLIAFGWIGLWLRQASSQRSRDGR